jgi:hypothetical protein
VAGWHGKLVTLWSAAGSETPRRFQTHSALPNIRVIFLRSKAVSPLPLCHRSPYGNGLAGNGEKRKIFRVVRGQIKSEFPLIRVDWRLFGVPRYAVRTA